MTKTRMSIDLHNVQSIRFTRTKFLVTDGGIEFHVRDLEIVREDGLVVSIGLYSKTDLGLAVRLPATEAPESAAQAAPESAIPV